MCNALVMQVTFQIIVLINIKTILENNIMTLNMVQTFQLPCVPLQSSTHTELYMYGSLAFTHLNISLKPFMHPHFKSLY